VKFLSCDLEYPSVAYLQLYITSIGNIQGNDSPQDQNARLIRTVSATQARVRLYISNSTLGVALAPERLTFAELGAEERPRTLSLIDFLADYDATRNPPVHDISKYRLFLLRDAHLPTVPGVRLSPAAEAWLTVDFLDLPARPEVPAELAELLGETASISPLVRPEIRPVPDAAEPS
jgi:hypothetical protein